ncbi:MAG: NAD-dependent deacylase [Candidatus Bipolaricaulota bacterium]|nr:NAD-dependent deacylase [Candidatus Bipolaricaulota bacterium]MDW8126436.1 NAD-dependent deacylase [Candidatus Bipolaricaulota bacterium]
MALDPQSIRLAARLLRESTRGWALTGAGVSTPSGIPDFRGPQGLWRTHNPDEVSTIDGFHRNPKAFYAFWLWRFQRMAQAQPNPVHKFLAALEAKGILCGVITQNIDGLHQRAGSRRVLEVHGHLRSATCVSCGSQYSMDWVVKEVESTGLACCSCGGLVKPDVVLFGEPLTPAFDVAQRELANADLLFVLGTSLTVWPVAGLVPYAISRGAHLIIANAEPTPYDQYSDVLLRGDLVTMSELLAQALEVDVAGS